MKSPSRVSEEGTQMTTPGGWLDKANAYRAGKPSGNYGWVFEYAKFRLNFAVTLRAAKSLCVSFRRLNAGVLRLCPSEMKRILRCAQDDSLRLACFTYLRNAD